MANGDVTTQEFVVKLTDGEIQERKDDLFQTETELDYEKQRKKNAMAEHNARIGSVERERAALLEAIRTGSEKRKIEVKEDHVFETNKVVYRRLDTNEVVDRRPMSSEERQQEMFDGKSDDTPPELKTSKRKTNGKRRGKQPGAEAT